MMPSLRSVRSRFLAILGCLVAFSLISGCGGDPSPDSATPGKVSERLKKLQDVKAKSEAAKK